MPKKSRAAVGLDGVAKADLMAMPDALHIRLLSLLHEAERSGQWPVQALNGAIHSLAKRATSEFVGDFRPVTILPLVYRCWGTIRSKEILSHLEKVAPPSMLGHMPKRSAPELWYHLQSVVEQSLYDGAAGSGLVTDLVRAFNCLPREPIFHAAIQIGVPANIVRAWAAAVIGIKRFFWVRGQPSEGVQSGTGFPEGCALSVAAMGLCNLVIHSFMAIRCPRVLMFSYVDNLELLSDSTDDALDGLRALQNFTTFLGVPCDSNKTYAWALDTQGRQQFKDSNLPVHRQHKDLGAHVQYCGRQTNGAVKQKCADLQTLWPSLAQSPAPLKHKLRVLTAVAWPRALHASSTVHLAEAILTDLRAGAMKGLRLDKSGAAPSLQFGLSQAPQQDPGFFVLWQSLFQFRKFSDLSVASSTLALACWTPDRLKKPGPCGVLAARLTGLGWTYVQHFKFLDQDGELIDIMHCPIQELKFRCKRAWYHRVGAEHAYRKGFKGLALVDVPTSVQVDPRWTPDEVGLMRVLHNGTFITHDQLHTAKQVDHDRCKFCGSQDSLFHRHWQCPKTAHLRNEVPPAVLSQVDALPQCTAERGWMVEPAEVRHFKHELQSLPSYVGVSQAFDFSSGAIDLFTDGSCLSPHLPVARLASWSLVQAVGHPDDRQFRTLASGAVPGQWQTILRAELRAVIEAAHVARLNPGVTRIWCDNATVVRRFKLIQAGKWVASPVRPDHDLWGVLASLLHDNTRVSIHKVDSHQQQPEDDDFLAWVFAGNDWADWVACEALSFFPPDVLNAQRDAAEAVSLSSPLCKHLHAHFVKVGMFSVCWEAETMGADGPHDKAGREPIDESTEISMSVVSAQAIHAPPQMQFSQFHKVREWLHHIQGNPDVPAVWVTWYELFWSFQLFTGLRGVQKQDCHSRWDVQPAHVPYDLVRECRSFVHFMHHLIRVAYPSFKSKNTRPDNYRWQSWSPSVPFRWSPNNLESVHRWMAEQLGQKQIKSVNKDLGQLEVAVGAVPCELREKPRVGLAKWFH